MNEQVKLYILMKEFDKEEEEPDTFLLEYTNYCSTNKTNKRMQQIILLNQRTRHSRPGLYSEMWVNLYNEYDFFIHFRMQRETFTALLRLMMQLPGFEKVFRGGLQPVSPEKCQQITIYYLGYQIPLVEIGDRFNLATSTVLNCVDFWITNFLQLVNLLIKWPTANERVDVEQKFRNLAGFPGVIGVIDGCHVNVMAPADQQRCYQNRYANHSIILQGICTADCLLTNVYVGHPGSANDARVLVNSKLCQQIGEQGPTAFFTPDQHLLGDKIYPLKTWLLPPFKDYRHMTAIQKSYNKLHSKTRVKVENCFGLLKGRWRRLKYIQVYRIEKASKIIMVCCLLHNFCLLSKDFAEELSIPEDQINRLDRIQVADGVERENRDIARNKRENIIRMLAGE